ncbi:Dynamin-related protein 4C [Sesamum alatum]|uniref:Dynamin-related protein 4C n=1 Tax=Sesamum alatum TaxID=300844 RepID=A0AAE1YSQ6_9LAMI|nr:Dynamin-related protein 4C [Sesamum alatum]
MGGQGRSSRSQNKTGLLKSENEENPLLSDDSRQKPNRLKSSQDQGVEEEETPKEIVQAPIISSYNDRIRPLLDVVDRLRHLNITQEGIQLPTIVVVGDQLSGKSSVLESLAGISLPRGQGICTRAPLIMRLQNHHNSQPEIFLEYGGSIVSTDEEHIADAITAATDAIAGKGKGISNNPLTLIVKKKGVPDLTMVDLPGITRVPVLGQPEDIYEQISKIIMDFITPEESIILNVLSASVDFTTCESIRMSQRVDKTGQRTLAVVTKVDKSPEGLLEKVNGDDVNIGLGYICVRNRIGDESYEQARVEEARLFENHPLLSRINKSMVGIPVLAQKLVQIQAMIILKCLPDIVRRINHKLSANVDDLNRLPQNLTSVPEAIASFMHVFGSCKESLRKILVRGEFDEYPDETEMHSTARLAEMLDKFSDELRSKSVEGDRKSNFLLEEINVLEENRSIGLPNFSPRAAFLTLLQKKAKDIYTTPFDFVDKMWNYIQEVMDSVLRRHSDNYPQLLSSSKRAAHNVVAKKRKLSVDWVTDIMEMEKLTNYTCNPDYLAAWSKLMAYQGEFMRIVKSPSIPPKIKIEVFGEINVAHLYDRGKIVQEAFDMKMRITAYWDVVLRRLVDCMALHLSFSVQNLVNKDMEVEFINEVMGPEGNGVKRMLEESPSVAKKRRRLMSSIKLFKESKHVVDSLKKPTSYRATTNHHYKATTIKIRNPQPQVIEPPPLQFTIYKIQTKLLTSNQLDLLTDSAYSQSRRSFRIFDLRRGSQSSTLRRDFRKSDSARLPQCHVLQKSEIAASEIRLTLALAVAAHGFVAFFVGNLSQSQCRRLAAVAFFVRSSAGI